MRSARVGLLIALALGLATAVPTATASQAKTCKLGSAGRNAGAELRDVAARDAARPARRAGGSCARTTAAASRSGGRRRAGARLDASAVIRCTEKRAGISIQFDATVTCQGAAGSWPHIHAEHVDG